MDFIIQTQIVLVNFFFWCKLRNCVIQTSKQNINTEPADCDTNEGAEFAFQNVNINCDTFGNLWGCHAHCDEFSLCVVSLVSKKKNSVFIENTHTHTYKHTKKGAKYRCWDNSTSRCGCDCYYTVDFFYTQNYTYNFSSVILPSNNQPQTDGGGDSSAGWV